MIASGTKPGGRPVCSGSAVGGRVLKFVGGEVPPATEGVNLTSFRLGDSSTGVMDPSDFPSSSPLT